MFQKVEICERLFDSRRWGIFKLLVYSSILPICFYFSIFDEPLFNKMIIVIGFAVFCVIVFRWEKSIAPVSYVDRFIVLMVVAAFLTTLRASDLMADQQGIAYTHIEELQRLLAAAFLSKYLYHKQKKSFKIGMQIVSWMIWVTAVYEVYIFVPLIRDAQGINSISSLENFMNVSRGVCVSVYRNPIPCCTCFVIGCALPLIRGHKRIDMLLKLVYMPAIVITYARSGWVGTVILVICLLYVSARKRNGKIGKWWILIIGIPILAACLLYILTVVHGKRLGGSIGRVKYWVYTLTVFFPERPLVSKLFGSGFYTSIIMDQTPVAMPGYPANDNAFVTILYEQGILGLAAVICLLWRAVKSIWNVDNNCIYGVALISACATACFYEMHFWAQAGFLAAVLIGIFWGRPSLKIVNTDV